MAVARRLTFTHRAQADLKGVWLHTVDRWDEEQADRYVAGLRAAAENLRHWPGRGKVVDERRPALRSARSGKHFIIYRRDGDQILVLAVLHERMDVTQHLP